MDLIDDGIVIHASPCLPLSTFVIYRIPQTPILDITSALLTNTISWVIKARQDYLQVPEINLCNVKRYLPQVENYHFYLFTSV